MTRIHKDDRAKLVAEGNRLSKTRHRLEIRDQVGTPDWCGQYAIPMDMEHESDGWCRMADAEIPATGEYWLDVQIAEKSYTEWEPMEWIKATFKDGRLVGLAH
jgi:hypothetical protein